MDELVVRYQPVVKLYDERIRRLRSARLLATSRRDCCLPTPSCPRDRDGLHRGRGALGARAGVWPIGAMAATMPDGPTTVDERQSFERERGRSPIHGSLARAITDSGVHARDVIVEINELILLDDPESAVEFLSQLSDLGVRLALEKFGSSFSPISYMHRISFDCLKIDRSFTAKAARAVGNYVARRVDL